MDRIHQLQIDDQGMAFDPVTGGTFCLNTVALTIVSRWREGWEDQRVTDELAKTYQLPAGEIRRDVNDLRASMQSLGLLMEGAE